MKQRRIDEMVARAVNYATIEATREERERCAKIAENYKERALQDGMIMSAAVGKIIAEAIRGS